MRELKDCCVLVLGLGESGLAMVRWCLRAGARVRVADTRADFEWMFEQSREVTEAYRKPGYGIRLWHLILRLTSSLM